MNRKEVVCQVEDGECGDVVRRTDCHGLVFCGDELRKYVKLPRNIKKCWLVFSDRPTTQNWELEGYNGVCADIVEMQRKQHYFMNATKRLLGKYYNKGYNYLHIEYEV